MFPFRPWVVVRVEWDSNQPRVQSGTSPLPHAGPRENEVASARVRGQVRVRGRFGQLGASPCCVSEVRKTAHQSFLGPEKTLARICREAGATVRCNAKLRDMDIAVSAQDKRAIEVLALGLPLHHGAQLAVNVTFPCFLTANSEAHPNAAADLQETGVVWWWWHWKPEADGATKPFSSSTILRRPDQGKHHQ